MNLPQFLKQIDADAAEMSREMLETFIHELARNLPESQRSCFLDIMHTVKSEDDPRTLPADSYSDDLAAEVKEVTAILEGIDNGEKRLDSEYNVEWDDWYNSDAEEVLFSDPQRLLPDIENGIELLHQCIDMEEYDLGCGLADLLSALVVSAAGDYNDCDGSPLGINELYEHGLLDGSFEKVVRESLFLTYMGNELPDRAEKLFCVMENYQCYDVKLENIMQMGNHDLPEFREFLPLWINCLGDRTGLGVRELLQEAQAMVEDDYQRLDMVRKFVGKHPELYKQMLEDGFAGGENERLFQIGMEALEKIPDSYVIRSEIALLTAEYAYRMNENAASEYCWLEAFRSDTTVVNYMRMRFIAEDWSQYKEQVKQIYNDVYERTKRRSGEYCSYYDANLQIENSLHNKAYCAILFLEEDFDGVMKQGMGKTEALGWSSTFMKEGLAFFLLLLFNGAVLPKGLRSMLVYAASACNFHVEAYLKGTGVSVNKEDQEFFWELFCIWKAKVSVPEKQAAQWIKKIEQLISVRTAGIMEANRRNYYGECAAFIAALGEVKESRGIKNAKAVIMNSYKDEYSRRRLFHQELRNYGMKK